MYGGYRFATCPASQCADRHANPNRDTHRHSRYANAYPDTISHTDLYSDTISDAHLVHNPHTHFHILPHSVSHPIPHCVSYVVSHTNLHADAISNAYRNIYSDSNIHGNSNSLQYA